MHLFYLALIVAFYIVSAISGAQELKRLMGAPVTERIRVRFYTDTIAGGWVAAFTVLLLCLVGGIRFREIGLRPMGPIAPGWFSVGSFAVCGGLFAVLLYQVIAFCVSAKYREETRKKYDCDEGQCRYGTVVAGVMIPRSRKEKLVFFFVSLTAGIGEEIMARGVLFFLLQSLFPQLSVGLMLAVAGLIFGIAHSYQGVSGILQTASVGALFGCIYLNTGSLLPVMLLHFLLDFSSAFLLSDKQEKKARMPTEGRRMLRRE